MQRLPLLLLCRLPLLLLLLHQGAQNELLSCQDPSQSG